MNPRARKEYIKRIETELAQIREDLAPLESGEISLSERKGDGPWRDTTQEMIAFHKRNVETYEAILDALRKSEVP